MSSYGKSLLESNLELLECMDATSFTGCMEYTSAVGAMFGDEVTVVCDKICCLTILSSIIIDFDCR